MSVVEARELRRNYGAIEALRGVSFTIEPGEIVGLLGPNGAGKSTTMKILTGWIAPTGGTARVCGVDVLADPIAVRRQIGYLPENAPVDAEMTVRGYLDFIARVRSLGAAERARGIDAVADEVGIRDRLGQRIGTLSKGFRQRVGLAQALIHRPKFLILDEPTSGLDPNQIAEVRALVRRIGETRTVVLSTHILSEVTATCGRVLIIHQGRLVADGPVEQVVARTQGHVITVGLAASTLVVPEAQVVAELGALAGVQRADPTAPGEGEARRVVLHADTDVRAAVFGWAASRGHVLVELTAERSNLEDVFRRLTVSEAA